MKVSDCLDREPQNQLLILRADTKDEIEFIEKVAELLLFKKSIRGAIDEIEHAICFGESMNEKIKYNKNKKNIYKRIEYNISKLFKCIN